MSESSRQTLQLRRTVRSMVKDGLVRVAHPNVAKQLSAELSQKLGRKVTIPARRIVQVEFGSSGHAQLAKALKSSIGIGIYPSPKWGHNKLRIGDSFADSVPKAARPFPSTNTRARLVPGTKMHRRFYEAVFAGDSATIAAAATTAQTLTGQKAQSGMGCASFVSKILRDHVKSRQSKTGAAPYDGRLSSLMRSESAAGPLWRKALGATPGLIVVYTPPGDYRSVSHPAFRFDYATKPGK